MPEKMGSYISNIKDNDTKSRQNAKETICSAEFVESVENATPKSKKAPSSAARLGTLCCVIGATSWGFSGTCGEALFSSYPIDAAWVTALRMLGAGTILLLAAAAKGKLPVRALLQDKKAVIQMVLFSLLGLVLSQYAYLNAIKWTNSGTATVLQNLSIIFVAVFVCAAERTFPTKRTLFCICLAFLGVWLIATGGRMDGMELTAKGLFWGIMGGVGAAAYFLLSKNPVKRWGSIPATGMGMWIGGVLLSGAVRIWEVPSGLDGRAAFYLGVLVVIGSAVAYTLFLKGVSLTGPVRASVLACLEPLTAACLSAVWLHSVFTPADLIGFVCILATVLIMK